MQRFFLTSLFALLVVVGFSQQVQNFSLKNVVNGQNVSLETYEHYRNRIKKLSTEISEKIPVILVNSNTEPAESDENMAKKARELGLKVPYLADKEQVLMQQLGAAKSPHAFLLRNNNGKFSVVYKGAIDDNAQVESDVKHAYLKDAIDIMLANQTITTPEVRPAGCTIRKK
jgi:hypothetical protein